MSQPEFRSCEENLERTIKLHTSALPLGNYFALHVKGDSMQDAGIKDGILQYSARKAPLKMEI
jgi:SOS-response transcriptional repressor LexA